VVLNSLVAVNASTMDNYMYDIDREILERVL
jgi:hypothetical protein